MGQLLNRWIKAFSFDDITEAYSLKGFSELKELCVVEIRHKIFG